MRRARERAEREPAAPVNSRCHVHQLQATPSSEGSIHIHLQHSSAARQPWEDSTMALGALARPSRSLDFVRDYPHHTIPQWRGEARRERARVGERELERGRLTQDDRYALPRRRRGLQRRRLSRIHITLRLGLDRHRPLHRTVCGGSSMVSNTPLREGRGKSRVMEKAGRWAR